MNCSHGFFFCRMSRENCVSYVNMSVKNRYSHSFLPKSNIYIALELKFAGDVKKLIKISFSLTFIKIVSKTDEILNSNSFLSFGFFPTCLLF